MKAHLLPSSVCCILLCSISLPIALTSILPPLPLRSIPRLPPEPWATHEVADADELLKAAQLVGDACVRDANAYGWAPVGTRQNLGVFIWAGGSAGSLENTSLLLPGHKPSDQLPTTITS